MRIGIPMADGVFSAHFGRCDSVFLCEVDPVTRKVERERIVTRATGGGECESLPQWLKAMAVEMVVAGGMGAGAQQRMAELGVAFSAGHQGRTPQEVLQHYFDHLGEDLPNACGGHEHGDHEHQHCKH